MMVIQKAPKKKPQTKFKNNAVRLCGHLSSINKKCDSIVEEYKITLATGIVKQMAPKKLIGDFISATKQEWERVVRSDLDYFLSHSKSLFSYFGEDMVDDVCKIVQSPNLQDSDRNRFWKLLKVMIANCIEYIGTIKASRGEKLDAKLSSLREEIINCLN